VPLITVHAETLTAVTARIEFTNKIAGADKSSKAFTFVLEALDKDAPMPDHAELTVTGAGTEVFFITYDQTGEYTYRLCEKLGKAERWTYDNAVYTVKVYVLWDEKTNQLEAYTLYYNEESYKMKAVFMNTYESETVVSSTPKVNLPKTGDDSNVRLFAVIGLFSLLICLINIFSDSPYGVKKK